MRSLFASLLAVPLVFGAMPAFAQSNPSAAQIIQSLTPKGNLLTGHTRGIRLAPSASTPAPGSMAYPTTTHPAASAPQTQMATATAKPMSQPERTASTAAPSVNLNVDFATNSAQLTPQARATLDQLGQALSSSQLSSYRFRIVGHTDTVGSPGYNKTLSEQRADTVMKYLVSRFGVAASRLQAQGVGEADLLVPTPPQTPERRNRRVQVINLGA